MEMSCPSGKARFSVRGRQKLGGGFRSCSNWSLRKLCGLCGFFNSETEMSYTIIIAAIGSLLAGFIAATLVARQRKNQVGGLMADAKKKQRP